MTGQVDVKETQKKLKAFLDSFDEYAGFINSGRPPADLRRLRTELQRVEPEITELLLRILGNGTVRIPYIGEIRFAGLLSNSLAGGNNADPINFAAYSEAVRLLLNRAVGTIGAGLWPAKEPAPVLIIRDVQLRERCSDLLRAPGAYDRVIREATTILEDRIRNKCPHATLSHLIPNSGDQTGENLVDKLFSPDAPVLTISDDRGKRIAFRKVLVGTFSYLRNQLHHAIDETTEWSWAWSTVGFIDRLLTEVEGCTVIEKD